MKKITLFLLGAATLISSALPAAAVTKDEMEQARTIAATRYLRYANNMSAYLDDIAPKTMQELESQLKDKEKENLKAFTAIATPADYTSWDKEKLVAYWGGEFFKTNSSLDKKGADCYNDVKKRIQAMSVSAPGTPEAAPSAATTAITPGEQQAGADLEQMAQDAANPDAGLEEQKASETKEKGSNTWTYVIILGILIIVVIWLVVYASKALKGSSSSSPSRRNAPRRQPRDPEDFPSAAPGKPTPSKASFADSRRETIGDSRANDSRTRRMERDLTQREAEIRRLEADLKVAKSDLRHAEAHLEETSRMLDEVRSENHHLRSEIYNLTEGIAKKDAPGTAPERPARRSFHSNPVDIRPAETASDTQTDLYEPKPATPRAAEVIAPLPVTDEPKNAPKIAPKTEHEPAKDPNAHIYMPQSSAPAAQRTIFLGRVNSKGIFVRADKNFNPGNSYYRLVTSDGSTGTFSVINDASVWELALVQPDDVLFNACSGPQFNETYGRNEIITETPGKAIFEDGAWKVTRKAQIRYL